MADASQAHLPSPFVPSPSTPPVGVSQDELQPLAEVEGRDRYRFADVPRHARDKRIWVRTAGEAA
ncbi:hypothetical protein FG486_05385 [Sphingomonas ursincola]|uniref:Uncharacterized protein n=1 Tax=Sphingomonas ursincola TaxID=56361 RepID=A0A7V8U879_9SPHN|nr:hypothetical protein [Sphingomonas ursincola]